jgi:hypothetical protein
MENLAASAWCRDPFRCQLVLCGRKHAGYNWKLDACHDGVSHPMQHIASMFAVLSSMYQIYHICHGFDWRNEKNQKNVPEIILSTECLLSDQLD